MRRSDKQQHLPSKLVKPKLSSESTLPQPKFVHNKEHSPFNMSARSIHNLDKPLSKTAKHSIEQIARSNLVTGDPSKRAGSKASAEKEMVLNFVLNTRTASKQKLLKQIDK